MAFYIVVKGKLTPFQFPYLDEVSPARVESTLIHSEKPSKGKNKTAIETLDKEVYAIDIMSRELITLSPAAKVKDADVLMRRHRINHIPLLVDQLLTGLISKRDIPEHPTKLEQEIRVHEVMSRTVLAASENTPLRHVAKVFIQENINSLPIVDQDFFVTGIITHRDLISWLLENRKFQRS